MPRHCGERGTPNHRPPPALLPAWVAPGENGAPSGAAGGARSRPRFGGKSQSCLPTSHLGADFNLQAPPPGHPSPSLPARGRLLRRPYAVTNALQIPVVFVKVYSPCNDCMIHFFPRDTALGPGSAAGSSRSTSQQLGFAIRSTLAAEHQMHFQHLHLIFTFKQLIIGSL